MSLKRKIAEYRIKAQSSAEQRRKRKIETLALQRNRALKEARDAIELAKAKEENRKAQLDRMEARERLQHQQSKATKARRQKAAKTAREIGKGLKPFGDMAAKGLRLLVGTEKPKRKTKKRRKR